MVFFLISWQLSRLFNEAMSAVFSGGDISALSAQEEHYATINLILMVLMGIWGLVTLLPMLGAWVRRLHDVGKSGHMLWLILLCGIGGLIPLFMCIADGKPETNQYGESPKYVPQP